MNEHILASLSIFSLIIKINGRIAWFVGSIFAIGWYMEWLDINFLWRPVALVGGIITFPIIPIATIIEWLWHGWPSDITVAFIFTTRGILTSFIGVWIEDNLDNWL